MAKKNPYVFTIGFDETDPVHVRAAEILNGTKKKAQLIAAAILSYVDDVDSETIPDFHVESFQPLLEKLIQKELEKVMSRHLALPVDKEGNSSDSVLDLSTEEKEMDESITRNIMEAMDTFRRN
jgi:hypothetical protein